MLFLLPPGEVPKEDEDDRRHPTVTPALSRQRERGQQR